MWNEPGAAWYASECERKGLPWGSWHFLRKRYKVADQVKFWLETPRSPFFPRQVDYEHSKLDGSIPNASELLEACRRLEDAEGRAVIVYSRYRLVDTLLATMTIDDLNARYWWLAQYYFNQPLQGEYRAEPTLPKRLRRDRLIILQTADHLPPPPGFTPDAKAMDYDRFVGTMTLEAFVANHGHDAPRSVEQRLSELERTAHIHA